MVIAKAPGKIILLGEHFVLYGHPALAASLDIGLTVRVELAPEDSWINASGRNDSSASKPLTPTEQQQNAAVLSTIKTALGLENVNLCIEIESDLPRQANLGSGAAFCVALTRALSALAQQTQPDEEIIRIATAAEYHLHGQSSGLDTSVVTLGGVVKVSSNQTNQRLYQRLAIPSPLHLVIAQTGTTSPTRVMIGRVRDLVTRLPAWFQTIQTNYAALIQAGEQAMRAGDLDEFGRTMNKNHDLLAQIGVSTPKLDQLCTAARAAGALGAKLTGGGGGGAMFALCQGAAEQAIVAAALTQAGAQSTLQVVVGKP